jgi:DNA-binding NarL/FixJ family response regulator
MDPAKVPKAWRDRVVPLALVPLLPEEAGAVLKEGGTLPRITGDDVRLARAIARGVSLAQIARDLGLPLRTVQRKCAQFRERFGVESTAELAAALAKEGF